MSVSSSIFKCCLTRDHEGCPKDQSFEINKENQYKYGSGCNVLLNTTTMVSDTPDEDKISGEIFEVSDSPNKDNSYGYL